MSHDVAVVSLTNERQRHGSILQSRDGSIFLTVKPSTADTVQHSIMVNIT